MEASSAADAPRLDVGNIDVVQLHGAGRQMAEGGKEDLVIMHASPQNGQSRVLAVRIREADVARIR